jgi:hypothetical protein
MIYQWVQGLGCAFFLALVLRLEIRNILMGGMGGFLLLVALANLVLVFPDPLFAFDYGIFRRIGSEVWAGVNPYHADCFSNHPFLNPPTALPLFAGFALIPLSVGKVVWTIGNALALCGLVHLAQLVLIRQDRLGNQSQIEPIAWKMPAPILVGLTGCFAVSTASFTSFATGQLSILVTLALLAALDAQSRKQPLRAGLWLALASIKVTTLLPFLLLFTRRADLRTWISFGAGLIVLTFLVVPPTQLSETAKLLVQHIRELQESGQVNDYSFQGTQHTTMLGLDHALYRLGMRDLGWIQIAQYVGLLALTLIVGWLVILQGKFSRAAGCSLVAAFSAIFLYHRIYDTVVLVIPLVYCAGWARAAQGRLRWLFAGTALAIMLVLSMPINGLWALARYSLELKIAGRLIQATLLPYATWAVLAAMLGVAVGGLLFKRSQLAKMTVGTQK